LLDQVETVHDHQHGDAGSVGLRVAVTPRATWVDFHGPTLVARITGLQTLGQRTPRAHTRAVSNG
jgi:hypothetical protein